MNKSTLNRKQHQNNGTHPSVCDGILDFFYEEIVCSKKESKSIKKASEVGVLMWFWTKEKQYILGKSENGPMKIEFLPTLIKIKKKLKGNNISISADLTKTHKERNKVFRNFLTKLRCSIDNNCYINREALL